MKTTHQLVAGDARRLAAVPSGSVQLVVTSPPYPMIEMWDGLFDALEPRTREAMEAGDPAGAFELMHRQLDRVWEHCFRVLAPGCFACINIGDATRTVAGDFQLFSNHSRIIAAMARLGFHVLPDILWRKQTNAPNKFMGSGMLPAGAFVTYEHEYILIFRKGSKRAFLTGESRLERRRSAFFWEERNAWFSDVWFDLKGTGQDLADPEARARSAAFPFELPYRLIQMYSLAGETVLDPFLGTGTTTFAAIASARSSIGVELEPSLLAGCRSAAGAAALLGTERARRRLEAHREFVAASERQGKTLSHRNRHYGFPVMTGQEEDLVLYFPLRLTPTAEGLEVEHGAEAPRQVVQAELLPDASPAAAPAATPSTRT